MCTYRFRVVPVAHGHMLVEKAAEGSLLIVQCSCHNEDWRVIPKPNIYLLWGLLDMEPELWCAHQACTLADMIAPTSKSNRSLRAQKMQLKMRLGSIILASQTKHPPVVSRVLTHIATRQETQRRRSAAKSPQRQHHW